MLTLCHPLQARQPIPVLVSINEVNDLSQAHVEP